MNRAWKRGRGDRKLWWGGGLGWGRVLFYYWQDNDTFSCKLIHIHGTHSHHSPPTSPKMCLSPPLRSNVHRAYANRTRFTLRGILGSSDLTKFDCSGTRISMPVFRMFSMPKLNFGVTLQTQSNYCVCHGTEMFFCFFLIDN